LQIHNRIADLQEKRQPEIIERTLTPQKAGPGHGCRDQPNPADFEQFQTWRALTGTPKTHQVQTQP